jgi:coatomer subunit beta'
MNVAFVCYFSISDLEKCYEVLLKSERVPEAALFAKTYLPSKITETVELWKAKLAKTHPLTA